MSANQLIHLQQKLTNDNQALQQTLNLKMANENEREKGKRTIKELSSLDPNTNSYRSVGRMFLQQPLPELLGTLDVMMVKVDTQIDALDKKSKYIEKQIAEDEKNLNEIVQQIYAKQGPAK